MDAWLPNASIIGKSVIIGRTLANMVDCKWMGSQYDDVECNTTCLVIMQKILLASQWLVWYSDGLLGCWMNEDE